MKNTGYSILKVVITVFFLSLLVFFSIASFNVQNIPNFVEDIFVDYSFTIKDSRLPSLELCSIGENWVAFDGKKKYINKPFAYLGISLTNKSSENKEFILYNQAHNFYTELLEPTPTGGITLERHGESVFLTKSPFSHYKAAFTVMVPANETREYILEYKDSNKIIIEPKIATRDKWYYSIIYERALAAAIGGFFLFFIGLVIFSGLFVKDPFYFSIAFFCTSLFLFFLTQSRILLLFIDLVTLPMWIFPFTVLLNLISSSIFIFSILHSYMLSWQKKGIQILIFIDFFCMGLFFVLIPFANSIILKILTIATCALFLPALLKAFKEKNKFVISISIVFSPFLFIMLFNFLAFIFGFRKILLQEFYQAFILLTSFVLLVIIVQYNSRTKILKKIEAMNKRENTRTIEFAQALGRVSQLRRSVLDSIAHQLFLHLDAIEVSLNSFNKKDFDNAFLVKKSIEAETEAIRKLIDKNLVKDTCEIAPPKANEFHISQNTIPQDKNIRPERIYILNSNWQDAERIALLLHSENFECIITSDRAQILEDAEQNLVSIIIVDTASNDGLVFSLCRILREKFNPLALPILMITDTFAHSTMKKGFAAGVNDFLMHNFESAELVSRICSLVKLREIFFLNTDLINSEKAKNTFLYFLTHNINTPLTLLLNHIRELEKMNYSEEYKALIEDMDISAREINETVQNVLVSFRLSDGRQTLRFEQVFVNDVVSQIQFDLERKAKLKHQKMTIHMNDSLKPLWADRYAIRGSIYNLVDNAIKFTPPKGRIGIFVQETVEALIIEIKDSGPGIAENEQTKLFERFSRLSSRPTGGESSIGLGLYIVYELAQMNNGKLSYHRAQEDTTFTGACFTLKFNYVETEHE